MPDKIWGIKFLHLHHFSVFLWGLFCFAFAFAFGPQLVILGLILGSALRESLLTSSEDHMGCEE